MFKLFKNVSYKQWQRSILVILLLEIMLIGLVIADGSKVWANRMAVMSSFAIKAVDLVIVRDDPVLKNQLLKMLDSQTHFVFLPDHIIQDTAPPPSISHYSGAY